MIQKFTIYRAVLADPLRSVSPHKLEDAMASHRFQPTAPTQVLSVGFVPPREDHGALLESVAGQLIAKVAIERRTVPGATLRKRVEEVAASIEAATGRKPGKKERRQIKEDAVLALLPQAFPKLAHVLVWFSGSLLVIGTTSQSAIDEIVTLLVRSVDGLRISPVVTKRSPAGCMAAWLATGEAPGELDLGRDCELQSADEERAVVRYSRHDLHGEEVRRHVAEGKLPRRLALNWKARVAFRLSETMAFDKVDILEVVFAVRDDNEADAFDANVAISTAELRAVIDGVIEAMGGELHSEATQ